MDEQSNAIDISQLTASLLTEIRGAWHDEEMQIKAQDAADQAEIKADEQRFEHHLVVIELGTVFVAVITIIVMQRMKMEGLCEVGTLIPTCLLALFRIVRS